MSTSCLADNVYRLVANFLFRFTKVLTNKGKPVFDDNLGRLKEGDVVDILDRKANFYIQEGLAMPYQTKVLQDRPLPPAGATAQSSPLPPAPTSQPMTASESVDGEKKRGRKPKQSS